MNSESPSYTYLDAILDPYIQPLKEAFDQEWQKYYEQVSDVDKRVFKNLPDEVKRNWGYLSGDQSDKFDNESIQNIYKADFLRRVIVEIREIGESYHRSHSKEHYLASQLFYAIKVEFTKRINDCKSDYNSWNGMPTQQISRPLDLTHEEAENLRKYHCWKADLNTHLYSEALRIIDEVRKQVDNKQ
jgi:hypothetical protein